MGRSDFVTAGLLLVAVVFAGIAMGISWGSTGDPDFAQARFGAFTVTSMAGGDVVAEIVYKGMEFEDTEGAGLVRAGAGLLLSGLIVLAAAVLAYEHRFLLQREWIGNIGLGLAGLGFMLWLVGLILLPIGIDKLAASVGGPFAEDVTWGAGLVMAIISGVFQLAAVAFAAVRMAMAGGFRLELADEGGVANFD